MVFLTLCSLCREVLERELAQTKRKLREAQEEINGLQYLVDQSSTTKDTDKSELAEDERAQLEDEVEDLKFDLTESERARHWLSQRLSSTIDSMRKLQVRLPLLPFEFDRVCGVMGEGRGVRGEG
jgi:septal ring factor EnvC (AmiA/AmiB activator)